jgi:hypothetical protein
MVMQKISVDQVVDTLNELIELDRQAMYQFIKFRVECNDKLVNHPSVQVSQNMGLEYDVGLIGIINALFPNLAQHDRIAIQFNSADIKDTFKFVKTIFPSEKKKSGIYTHPDHYHFRDFALSNGNERKLKELDVVGDSKGGFCWGHMTDFGNPVSDEMWWEMKFIRDFTESDRESMGAFTALAFEIDD